MRFEFLGPVSNFPLRPNDVGSGMILTCFYYGSAQLMRHRKEDMTYFLVTSRMTPVTAADNNNKDTNCRPLLWNSVTTLDKSNHETKGAKRKSRPVFLPKGAQLAIFRRIDFWVAPLTLMLTQHVRRPEARGEKKAAEHAIAKMRSTGPRQKENLFFFYIPI
jgi:hypothetical protein